MKKKKKKKKKNRKKKKKNRKERLWYLPPPGDQNWSFPSHCLPPRTRTRRDFPRVGTGQQHSSVKRQQREIGKAE